MTNATLWEKGLRPLVLFILFSLLSAAQGVRAAERHTSKHEQDV